jgi:hypothetical protein
MSSRCAARTVTACTQIRLDKYTLVSLLVEQTWREPLILWHRLLDRHRPTVDTLARSARRISMNHLVKSCTSQGPYLSVNAAPSTDRRGLLSLLTHARGIPFGGGAAGLCGSRRTEVGPEHITSRVTAFSPVPTVPLATAPERVQLVARSGEAKGSRAAPGSVDASHSSTASGIRSEGTRARRPRLPGPAWSPLRSYAPAGRTRRSRAPSRPSAPARSNGTKSRHSCG